MVPTRIQMSLSVQKVSENEVSIEILSRCDSGLARCKMLPNLSFFAALNHLGASLTQKSLRRTDGRTSNCPTVLASRIRKMQLEAVFLQID